MACETFNLKSLERTLGLLIIVGDDDHVDKDCYVFVFLELVLNL